MKNSLSIFMLITQITSTILGTLSPFFIFPTWASPPDYVVINEVLYDPQGTDLGYEFMELYNPTNQNIDLSNWTIESGGTSFAKVTTIPQGTVIVANTYFVIGEEHVESANLKVAKLEFQNGGSETDGVRIKDNECKVIDTLLYDEPNDNSLLDDTGNAGTKFAPDIASGSSLGRDKDSSDTNDSSQDYKEYPEPTPGVINEQEEQNEPEEEYSENIRISELLPNPTGSDSEDEFIELENFGSEDVDLVGWILEDASGNHYIIDQEDFTSTIITTGGFFAVFREISGISLNNTGSEEVRLYQPDENLLDFVAYQGTVVEGSSYAYNQGEFSWTTTPTSGEKNVFTQANEAPVAQAGEDKEVIVDEEVTFDGSDSSDPNGGSLEYAWDFGDGSQDVGLTITHSYSQVSTYLVTLTVSDGLEEDADQLKLTVIEEGTDPNIDYPDTVIITEVLPDPEGDDAEGEFVEIQNIGSQEVDISGWELSDGTDKRFIIPENTALAPDQYQAFFRDQTGMSFNNSGGDSVVLYHPNDEIVDQIDYSSAEAAQAYALFDDGWKWTNETTPGEPNKYVLVNDLPQAVIEAPEEGRVGTAIVFDASDSEDADDDELDFAWDFGNGGNGSGQEVEHSYNKSGTFLVALTVSDGKEQDIATHSLIIKDYDYAEEIYISELLPDPEGNDAEEEYIELTNKEGRDVELAGWSLADEKTTYLFPDGTVIEKDEILLIMRSESDITLNNDQDKATLFNPRNEVIDELSYENTTQGYSLTKNELGEIFATSSPTPGQENILAVAENGEKKDGDEQDEEQIGEDDDSKVPTKNEDETREPETTSIESIKSLAKGEEVKISGSVVVLPDVFGSQYFYVFDGESGIQIYSYKKLFPELGLWDKVEVVGKVSESRGEKRINIANKDDIEIIGPGEEFEPLDLTGKKLDEEYEGSLARIDGNIIDRKSTKLILDSDGVEVEVSIKKGANISTKELVDGQSVSIIGIISQSKDKYVLLPRNQEDIASPKVLGKIEKLTDNSDEERDKSVENGNGKMNWLDPRNKNNVLIILATVAGVILLGGVIVLAQPKVKEALKKKIEMIKKKQKVL